VTCTQELSGIPPTRHMHARFGEGIYTPEFTSRTYQHLADQAEQLLALGETVVVDASFSIGEQRDLLRSVGNLTSVTSSNCGASPPRGPREPTAFSGGQPAAFSDADSDIAARMTATTRSVARSTGHRHSRAPAHSLRLALRSLARG